ncbi:MAG: CapA family protein [Bacteroidales bacterium]|nr:CapA family protein [Bacteroidales bacterium]
MRKWWIVTSIYFIKTLFVVAQTQENEKIDSLTILFAGDIMGHMPQIRAAYDSNSKSFSFEPCFRFVKPFLDNIDIAVANLETTLAGPPYTGYPLFSSPDELAYDASMAGFDILATANNHCYDKGKKGMERTIKALDSMKIVHIGTYLNSTERDTTFPLILIKKNLKIALFNYTYGTNGIPVDSPNIVNIINRKQIIQDIKKADSLKVDIKIVFLHWGKEYETSPNEEQKNLANFLVKQGVDIIVGSHPHVVQTFEEITDTARKKNVPVFYSLGNFISNQRDPDRDGGAMAVFTIRWRNFSDSITSSPFFTISTRYIPYWVYKGFLGEKYHYYVLPLPNNLNINIPVDDKKRMNEYFDKVKLQLYNLTIWNYNKNINIF